jgi:1,2-diacylglycerol 3-alpha-glucosyltransferase
MKIIYATDNYWPRISGMGVSLDAFRVELEKMGHIIYVYSPKYPDSEEFDKKRNEPRVIRFDSYALLFATQIEDRMVYPWKRKEVFKKSDEIAPDLVHVHTEFPMGRLTREYAQKRGLPIVMTCHTYFEEYVLHYFPWLPKKLTILYLKNRLRRTFQHADVIIVPTSPMISVLRSYGITKPIKVLATGIDPEKYKGVTKANEKKNSFLYESYPELKTKKILAFAGRIGIEKNIPFLLDVVDKLKDKHPDIALLIAGNGPYLDTMKEITKKRGLEKFIYFTGYIDQTKMKNIYTLADIFVFPSKTETQGLVTIESMLCGTPVVAIGEMGTKEVMNGDNGGFMVEDDIDKFSEKVDDLLSNKKLYKEKQADALKYSKGWTIQVKAKLMEKLYEDLLKDMKK